MKNWMDRILTFLARAVIGMIVISLFSSFLAERGIAWTVGLNPLTFITSGLLGFPGLVLLYGLSFYFHL